MSSQMHTDLQGLCPIFLSEFNNTWIFSIHFQNYWNIEFLLYRSSGSWVVPCGRTDKTKLTVVFRSCAHAPTNDPATGLTTYLACIQGMPGSNKCRDADEPGCGVLRFMSAGAVVPKIRAWPPPSAVSPTTLSRNNRHQAIPTLVLAVDCWTWCCP